MKKQKILMVFATLTFLSLLAAPFALADSAENFGSDTGYPTTTSHIAGGTNYASTLVNIDSAINTSIGYAQLAVQVNNGYAKLAIFDHEYSLVAVSNAAPLAYSTDTYWQPFTFDSQVTLSAGNYTFMVVFNCQFHISSGSEGNHQYAGLEMGVTNYNTPYLVSSSLPQGTTVYPKIYIEAHEGDVPATTSTPAPSTTPFSFDDNDLGVLLSQIVSYMVPLILILIPAILLGYFIGAWGFFAGLNVGIILAYLMAGLPLWAVVAIILVDALLLFGKVGFSGSGQSEG